MESGFIYLWYDRKHKRFYLGKHWGPEDDGYICSSTWMKRAYKRRPEDFGERKILQRIYTNRKDLGEAERQWGLLIKEEELGTRYYNLHRPGAPQWHDDPETRASVGQKISKANSGEKHRTPENLAHLKRLSEANKGRVFSEESRRKISASKTGKKLSQEHVEAMRKGVTGKVQSEESKRKKSEALKGRKLSEEHRRKLSEARRRRT
jgi:hypothetical protein